MSIREASAKYDHLPRSGLLAQWAQKQEAINGLSAEILYIESLMRLKTQ